MNLQTYFIDICMLATGHETQLKHVQNHVFHSHILNICCLSCLLIDKIVDSSIGLLHTADPKNTCGFLACSSTSSCRSTVFDIGLINYSGRLASGTLQPSGTPLKNTVKLVRN